MKKKILLLFFVLNILILSKEYEFFKPKEKIILKTNNSKLILNKDKYYPLCLIKKNGVRKYFRFINKEMGINSNWIFEFTDIECMTNQINLEYYPNIEEEYDIEKIFTIFQKNKGQMCDLENFLFIQKILSLYLRLDQNEQINKTVYDYFSQAENKSYVVFMLSNAALRDLILTYNPLIVLTAFPEKNFFDIQNQGCSQDYKISTKQDVDQFFQIIKKQKAIKEKEKFYNDLNFAIDNYFTDKSLKLLLARLNNEKQFNPFRNYLSILEKNDFENVINYISSPNPLSFKYSLISNFSSTHEQVQLLRNAALKDNKINLEIFSFLPYSEFTLNLAEILNEITVQSIEKGRNKSPETLKLSDLHLKKEIPYEVGNYIEIYGQLIKSSVLIQKVIVFKDFGDLYKNFKFSYIENIKSQNTIIKNIGLIPDNYLRELYLLTIARIAMNQADIIIQEISKYNEMEIEMALLLDNVNLCISLSPLVKSDKDLNSRYGAAFIGLSLNTAKSQKDFDIIYNESVEYIKEYGLKYFTPYINTVRKNMIFNKNLKCLNFLNNFEEDLKKFY